MIKNPFGSYKHREKVKGHILQNSLDKDKSTGHVESSESPGGESSFESFQENVPGRVSKSRVNKRGAKVFRREMSKSETKDASYAGLDHRRGVKEEKLGFGDIDSHTRSKRK